MPIWASSTRPAAPVAIENSVGFGSRYLMPRGFRPEICDGRRHGLGAFRVIQESWVLRVQLPRSASETNDFPAGAARLAFADMTVVALPDRSILGRAVYETVPGSGSVLSFELPAGSSLLWATVDFNPSAPLRSASGTWSFALATAGRRESA